MMAIAYAVLRLTNNGAAMENQDVSATFKIRDMEMTVAIGSSTKASRCAFVRRHPKKRARWRIDLIGTKLRRKRIWTEKRPKNERGSHRNVYWPSSRLAQGRD